MYGKLYFSPSTQSEGDEYLNISILQGLFYAPECCALDILVLTVKRGSWSLRPLHLLRPLGFQPSGSLDREDAGVTVAPSPTTQGTQRT